LTFPQLFGDRGYRYIEKKDDREIEHVVNPAWFLVEADHDRDHAREIREWKKEVGIGEPIQTM
jgi:hypothetical protein